MELASAQPALTTSRPPALVGKRGLLRTLNYRAILDLLAYSGPTSRAGVAASLNLSRPSVTRLVDALIGAGLVREGERLFSKVGRKRVLLDINPDAALVVGASVRHRRSRLWLADLRGSVVSQQEVATDARSPTHLAEQLASLAATARAASGKPDLDVAGVAVGINAAWNRQERRLHAAPNLPHLEGQDVHGSLLHAFSEALGNELSEDALILDNDVNLAAIGEGEFGIARGRSSFFYLSLGSGVGGASVINGELLVGADGFAGEIGYLPASDGDSAVPLESLVSRTALAARSVALNFSGGAEHLLLEAEAGNVDAVEQVRLLGAHLGLAVAAVTTVLNPELIVLGGSIGRFAEVLIPVIDQALSSPSPIHTELVGTALGGEASLLGAVSMACLAAREVLVKEVH